MQHTRAATLRVHQNEAPRLGGRRRLGQSPEMADERADIATQESAPRVAAPRRLGPRPLTGLLIDNLDLAWLFLLLGSFSFTERSATEVLSGQLSLANLIRYGCMVIALASSSYGVPKYSLKSFAIDARSLSTIGATRSLRTAQKTTIPMANA